MPKQNDLILTLLANPQFTTEDFQKVGLSADNTSLEDENVYLSSKKIIENPLFKNESGEFDENKFHSVYIGASKMLQDLSNSTQNPQTIYSKYNIWVPVSQRDMSPQFELVRNSNPDRITKSMIVLGQNGEREYTPQEIAQSQQIFNSDTGKWMESPEDLFSFKKLFNDPIGFISDNFGNNKVMAQYEKDIDINGNKRGDVNFNENLIEHRKGEYMLNENGTYYYRTLKDGENIHGKQLLHYSDILTREGSALNSIDFLDSDDIEKNTFGTFVKNASLIGAMFLPYVGPAIAGATIFQQAVGLGATLGKIALQDSDNSTLNWIEGLSESTNPLTTRSEYSSGDKMWTTENLLGMVADVVAQLYQQRLIFKWAPYITKGKWGISEESQTALKNKYINEIVTKNKNSLDNIVAKYGKESPQAMRASQELFAQSQMDAAKLVEDYMSGYYKSGETLSKAYMTMLTVNDIYSEAKEAGASDFDASLITAGYAAMEYALLSTDIGKWILPELRASRLQNKAIVNALTKDTLETFKKLGAEAATNETAKRNYISRLVNWGKNQAKAVMNGEFNTGLGERAAFKDGGGLLKAGFGSLMAGASAEAVEETSEEVLADFSRVLFNGLQELKGNKDIKLQKPWEDEHLFDRYAMSFLGGFIGGGISSAAFDFKQVRKSLNMDYNKAVQELIWKARNNDLDGIFKILNNEKIGNENLSASKYIKDEEGNLIWKQGTSDDNQDLMIKTIAKQQIKLLQDTLEAHGGNMSDEHLISEQTLKDLRFRVLHNSTTAGKYIQKYNQLLGQLIEKTTELKSLDTPSEKVKSGETDKKERTNGESKEISKKRKKLEQEIKEIDEQIDNFNTGKLAPLFMTSALLETTPFISEVFMRSSFKTFAEDKAKTKYENIPEGELKTYWDQYQAHLRTTKKDDLDFATEGYLSLQKLIKQNFEEAKKVAQDSVNNPVVNQLLRDSQEIMVSLNELLQLDDDAWQESFQKFITDNPLTEKFITGIQLIRNTAKEAKEQADVKYNEDKAKYDQQLANGEIEESVYQSLIKGLDQNKQQIYEQADRGQDTALAEINVDMLIEQANQLADNFINLGYINGAIKDTVVSRLQELHDQLKQQEKYFESQLESPAILMSENLEDETRVDKMNESMVKIRGLLPELEQKIEQVKNLKYTPILQNLDQFALNLKSISVSQVLEQLGNIIQTNRTNIGAFTFGEDIHHAINEADRVIDLYIAALEGARTDTVDPFRINLSTGESSENLWGINKVLNEVHAKAPKIENDTWEDLPEIDGNAANMMLLDARSIKSLLQSYKKLFDINRGQKLEIQSRVGTRTSYLLYDRINRLLTNGDFPDKNFDGTEELKQTLNNLSFFNENVRDKDKKDWNINLSVEQQIALEKDKLSLETAIFDFFDKNKDKNWEPLFSNLLFNLGDSRTTLLTEAADDIDESSFIGYLVSKIAINSSDFYHKYKEFLKSGDKKIVPLLGQEIGVQLHLANILNGNVVTKAIQAYRNALYKHFKNLNFEDRVKFLKSNGISERTAQLLSTQRGFERVFSSYDLVPQYSNITFSDGIAGSGKTTAIMRNTIKFLQQYYSKDNQFTKIWTVHGGDSDTETTFAEGLRKSIGLTEDGSMTFNKKGLMDQITSERNLTTDASGKSYEFKDSDYKIINGRFVSNWKLKSYSKEELPDIIVIDEAQQLTQLDLLTLDKLARENGIAVIMSGDLQQSQMSGKFSLSPEDVTEINRELLEKHVITEEQKFDKDNTFVTLRLSRNQVLHTPKIGTSMRTENNQKNMNAATIQAAMEAGKGQIPLHYYMDDSTIAGDYWADPNDDISPILDKMIASLEEGEKINFAYSSEDSPLYKQLKANSTYWNKINPIKGIALGQEGNYWILDIDTYQHPSNWIKDLYTGITRAKKASLLVSEREIYTRNKDQSKNEVFFTLSRVQDQETHPEKYSEKAITKFVDKRIKVLEGALSGEGNDIPYNPRTGNTPEESSSEPPTTPTGPTSPEPPSGPEPTLPPTSGPPSGPVPTSGPPSRPTPGSTPSSETSTIKPLTLDAGKSLEDLAKEAVDNNLINIPAKGLTTGTIYNVPMIDYYHRKIVLVDVNGMKIPFYLSTGMGGKKNVEAFKWYPFWGIDPIAGWLNKTTESDINDYYGSPLLKAIAEALDQKFKTNFPEEVPLTDDDYDPMYNTINQTVGYNKRGTRSKNIRNRYNPIIEQLHQSIGYKEIEETKLPPVIEEIQPEDIEEESVSNEKETQGKLSDANREDNSATFDKVEISGFSKKDFNFYLFSNATFELGLGQNLINPDGTININSLLNNRRIDSLNGVAKVFGINNLQEGIEFLAEARDLLMSVEDKSDLEQKLSILINNKLNKVKKTLLGNLYVRFAIKTTEPKILNTQYDKAQKGSDETLPYARAQVDPNSESNFVNNRSLVAIIGENEDKLEIPLLMLNNPITIITQLQNGQYKYPQLASVYINTFNQAYAYAQNQPIRDKRGYAQIEALKTIVNTFTTNDYRGLTNLIRMYLDTNRKVSFIKDQNWTIGKNLHTFGPQLNLKRGQKTSDYNAEYVQEDRWIPLSQLREDPQLRITGIYHYTGSTEFEDDAGNPITIVSKYKHPFVLYTDTLYDHDGKQLNSDAAIIKEFLYQKTNPNAKQTIKLVYVLPPKFAIGEYIDSLIGFMVEGKKGVLGNQRTPLKVLEGLIYDQNGNVNSELIDVFKHSLGEQTGQLVYDKVKSIVDSMKGLSLQEQIKLLTNDTPQRWNINGFGLNSDVQLYQQLQNVIKQLVQPSSINILGNVNHKGSSDERASNTQKLSEIFAKSGLSLFYQTKGSKDESQIIYGRFSPIQEVKDGISIENDYISEKSFMINGNLSTSSFMANEEFNDIIEDMLKEFHPMGDTTPTTDGYSYFRDNYSGFNSRSQAPSISQEILNKLSKFGLTTTITPTIVNDNSKETKQKIADEINSKNSSIKALVLPNGELIIGKNDFFTGKNVEFRFDSNPFESQQNYQFDAIIDGEEYDVVYSNTNAGKIMTLTPKNNQQQQTNFYEYTVNPNLNIDRAKELLNIIASTSKRMEKKIQNILLTEDDKLVQTIIDFLNQDIIKTLIKLKNLDISSFNDILNFEQEITQDNCNLSINIQFI